MAQRARALYVEAEREDGVQQVDQWVAQTLGDRARRGG